MTLLALVSTLAALATAGPSADQIQALLDDDAGWRSGGTKEGVEVYQKDVPGVDVLAWKGVRVMDVDRDMIWALITDVGNHDQVSDMLHETAVLSRSGARMDYYQVSRSPRFVPVSERYWFNYAVETRDVGGEPGHHKRTWNSLPDVAPYADTLAAVRGRYPDAVPLALTHGSWELVPGPGERTTIIYRTVSDPGGAIPTSIMDYISGKSLPNNILQFEEAAKQRAQ